MKLRVSLSSIIFLEVILIFLLLINYKLGIYCLIFFLIALSLIFLFPTKKKFIFRVVISLPSMILFISLLQLSLQISYINNLNVTDFSEELDERLKESVHDWSLEIGYHKNYTIVKKQNCFGNPDKYSLFKIPRNKSKNSFYIYVYGGSSVVLPPGRKENFPYFLEEKLKSKYDPNLEMNLYNFGQSGYTVRAIIARMQSTLKIAKPDLIVLYTGHNDYIMAHHILREKLYLLYRKNILSYPLGLIYSDDEMMATGLSLLLLAREHGLINDNMNKLIEMTNDIAFKNYKRDIHRIINMTSENNITLVICTLISNLEFPPRDLKQNFNNLSDEYSFNNYVKRGDYLEKSGKTDEAISIYKEALKISNKSASVNYKLGNLYKGRENYELALNYLKKAKDFDNFNHNVRAKSVANNFLRGINVTNVYLVDIEKRLENKVPDIFPDFYFFSDMIHLNDVHSVADMIYAEIVNNSLVEGS